MQAMLDRLVNIFKSLDSRKLLVAAIAVCCISVLGFVCGRILTGRFEKRLVGALEKTLSAEIKYRKAGLTPLLQLVLVGVEVVPRGSDTGSAAVEVDRVVITPQFMVSPGKRVPINNIFLEKPLVTARVSEDGEVDLDPWLREFTECDGVRNGRGFPNRVTVSGGAVVVRFEGNDEVDPPTVDLIKGMLGDRGEEGIGVELEGESAEGPISLRGSFSGCRAGRVNLEFASKDWDADIFIYDALQLIVGRKEGTPKSSIGRGEFRVVLHGDIKAPSVDGELKTRVQKLRFAWFPGFIDVTEFKFKLAGGEVSGSGKVGLSDANAPVKMVFDVEDLPLDEMFRRSLGFRIAPRARLDGKYEVEGSLAAPESLRGTGVFESGEGYIRLPALPIGHGRKIAAPKIRFDGFTARVTREGGGTSARDLRLTGKGIEAVVEAEFGGLNQSSLRSGMPGGDSRVFSASGDIKITDLAEFLKASTAGAVSGEGSGRVRLRVAGVVGMPKKLKGGGAVSLMKGRLSNPFAGPADEGGGQWIEFDSLSAEFEFDSKRLRLESLEMNGNGLSVNMYGEIAEGGRLRLGGTAQMSGDIARSFASLRGLLGRGEIDPAVYIQARFDIGGSVDEPEVVWSDLRATQWRAE